MSSKHTHSPITASVTRGSQMRRGRSDERPGYKNRGMYRKSKSKSPNNSGSPRSKRREYKMSSKVVQLDDYLKQEIITYKHNNCCVSGFPSTAARQTCLFNGVGNGSGSYMFDAGCPTRESRPHVVMITHGHSDHAGNLLNVVHPDTHVVIFVPASIAVEIFKMIKYSTIIQKGRSYTDDEIVKMVRIIGCKRKGEYTGQRAFTSTETKDLQIAELIDMGEKVICNLNGRERIAVEPFPCYHTVPTCGYMVYEVRQKLSPEIVFESGTTVYRNFTNDQPPKKSRSGHKKSKPVTRKSVKTETSDSDSDSESKNYAAVSGNDPRFEDVVKFAKRHDVKIKFGIKAETLPSGHTLYRRFLHFPEGMNIKAKDDDGKCLLDDSDFALLQNKYKINVNIDTYIPKEMFFGDTCNYVFKNEQVMRLIKIAQVVIIESTFLETKDEYGLKKYKEHQDKRHMYLHQLKPIIRSNPDIQFLLIHFSACYDKDTIRDHVAKLKLRNVTAFV